MRKTLFFLIFATYSIQVSAQKEKQTTITVMDSIVFYDGYATTVKNRPPPAGVIMHRNSLFARKLTSNELLSIGTSLQMNVIIKALCDNYDRIGNVNMALVPIGSSTYNRNSVQRIELGRFITPFMNKNIQPHLVPYTFNINFWTRSLDDMIKPHSVPYTFNIDNVVMLLKDNDINSNFDIWIEFEVFGVPYAANKEVTGCSGRNDVFMGKLEFVTNSPAPSQNTNVLIPLYFKNKFNNYKANATDTIGMTTKSITFNVPSNVIDATLFLITSNHGANSGGEEYNRRVHYAYFDNNLELTYKPGRLTCEPFRKYNTQGNGIYGFSPRTNAQWQSFSNWCPGDVIDTRQIKLGSVTAGDHTFLIRVPTAVFKDGKGDIPLSLYFQAKTPGPILAINGYLEKDNSFSIYPNPTNGYFTLDLSTANAEIIVTDVYGKQIVKMQTIQKKNRLQLDKDGVYFIIARTKEGTVTRKLIVNK